MAEEFKSFFKRVTGNEGDRCHYNTRLDTYGCGCQHNCQYCYARSLLDFRKLWNPAYPSIANINRIRHTIRAKLKPGEIVRLGGMTDCFQPLEKENRVTYQTIEALNEMGVGYLIVTKNALVADDDYIAVYDKNLCHIQVSITSTDAELSRKIEPGASLPEERIAAVEKLQGEGFDVQVRLSPYVPEFVDVDRINSIRCDKILVEFLRVNSWIKKWLANIEWGGILTTTANSAPVTTTFHWRPRRYCSRESADSSRCRYAKTSRHIGNTGTRMSTQIKTIVAI